MLKYLTTAVALMGGLASPGLAQCWNETDKFAGTDPGVFNELGRALAIDGDTLLAGADTLSAPGTGAGKAYLFERDPGGAGTWSEQVQLTASNATKQARFGLSVALEGDTAVVGAPSADLGVGVSATGGLAFDSNTGRLLATDPDLDQLLELDRSTGLASVIGSLGPSDIRGLAFDASSATLYGCGNGADQLLRIDSYTASTTIVGPMGFTDVQGLAWDSSTGTLYGTDRGTDQLISIDPATGAGTAIGPLGYFNVHGLAYDSLTDSLYGNDTGPDDLLLIDRATGAAARIGGSGGNVRGLAFDASGPALYGVENKSVSLVRWDLPIGQSATVGPLSSAIDDIGLVYVFERDAGGPDQWGETRILAPAIATASTFFGHQVVLDGDTLIAWAVRQTSNSTYHVLDRNAGGPGSWGEVASFAVIGASGTRSMALSGDTLVVGSPYTQSGFVAVFERDFGGPNAWGEVTRLQPAVLENGDAFGVAVAIQGDRLVVGAERFDVAPGANSNEGAVFIFERDATNPLVWNEGPVVTAAIPELGENLGNSVSLDGDVFAAGTGLWPLSSALGRAVVFERLASGSWAETRRLQASDGVSGNRFGEIVAVSGTTVVSNAFRDSFPASTGGALYTFEASSVTSYCTAGVSASGCRALLSATGFSSSSAPSGFLLHATGVEGQKPGLFFYGTSGRATLPWGNGSSLKCTPLPVSRGALLLGNGTAGTCDGSFEYDLNARWYSKPAQNPGEGATVQTQLWYRDSFNTSNRPTSLSDALEFCVRP